MAILLDFHPCPFSRANGEGDARLPETTSWLNKKVKAGVSP
jgi:hypothetical protein